MTFKKMILGVVAAATTLTLAACGGATSSETDLADTITEKGKIVVAMNPEFAPFEFETLVDGKNTIVGSDVELAQAIADELGVNLELSPMSFDNVLGSLQSGKADIAISGISATAERAKVYDFSDAYYTAKNVVIVQEGAAGELTTVDSFAGKSIAVQKGSVQEAVAKEQLPDAKIVSLTSNGNMIAELVAGKVDAVILEEPIAKGYIANNAGITLSTLELDSSETDAYAVALPKGNEKLLEAVNKVVKELVDSGQYDQYVQEAYDLSTGETE
ncbi:transporter substrate-binding domain-containing protein [Streptococcus rifensis]